MPRESLEVSDLKVPTRDDNEVAVRLYKPRGGSDLPVVVL